MSCNKPINELSADDLRIHPIWEYAMDEEEDHDETYIRPVTSSVVPQDQNTVYQFACDVTAATGKSFPAFISICKGLLHHESPVIVGNSGEYWPLDPSYILHFSKEFEKFFGVAYKSLFPIVWQLRVSVTGEAESRSGICNGG